MVEHVPEEDGVAGSSPALGTKMQDIETPKTNEVDFSRIVDTLKESQDIRTDRINIDALTSLYE